jgi:hypothetical protein
VWNPFEDELCMVNTTNIRQDTFYNNWTISTSNVVWFHLWWTSEWPLNLWRLIHEILMVFGFIFLMTRCYCTVIDFTYLCFSKYMSSQFDYGGISLSNGSIYFIITDSNYSPMGLRLSLRRRHFVYNVDPRMR